MIGASTTEELKEMKQGIEQALLLHGFPLRKWASNDADTLEGIPEKDLEPPIQVGDQEVIKTLGVAWNPTKDVFQFISVNNTINDTNTITKRQMVSKILRLYDPLGLVQPVIITAKILMQELWAHHNIGWDEEVPGPTFNAWKRYESSLAELQKIDILG